MTLNMICFDPAPLPPEQTFWRNASPTPLGPPLGMLVGGLGLGNPSCHPIVVPFWKSSNCPNTTANAGVADTVIAPAMTHLTDALRANLLCILFSSGPDYIRGKVITASPKAKEQGVASARSGPDW